MHSWQKPPPASALVLTGPWSQWAGGGGLPLQKYKSVPPALTCTWTRRRMEHPLPQLFPCRLLGQQIKPHLFSEAHVLAQLLWRYFGVMLPPGKAQGCHTVLNGDSRDGAGSSTQVSQPWQQAPCGGSSPCIQSRAGPHLAVGTPGTPRTRHKGNSIFPKLGTISGGFQLHPG